MKLPKIQLRKFNGNPMNFMSFLEKFESAVHSNSNLSEIEKFCYLKKLLGEKPSNAIKGLTLSATNYRAALEILKTSYGNKQLIISSHMDKLCKLNRAQWAQTVTFAEKLIVLKTQLNILNRKFMKFLI